MMSSSGYMQFGYYSGIKGCWEALSEQMTYYFLGVSQGSLCVPLRPLLLFLLLLSQLFFTLPVTWCTKRWDFKQNTYPDPDVTFRRGTETHSTCSSFHCPWSSSSSPSCLQGCSRGPAVAQTYVSQCWSASPRCWCWSSCHQRSSDAPLPPSHRGLAT